MTTQEVEYIEPTRDHIGQTVEVSNNSIHWCKRELLEVLPNEIKYRFLTRNSTHPNGYSSWTSARVSIPLSYVKRQAKCGLKVGDRVRITRIAKSHEDGWRNQWLSTMDKFVGEVSIIESIHETSGMRLLDFSCTFPYFVLEKVTERAPTHSDIGAIVWVNGTPHCTYKLVLSFIEEDGIWRGVVKQNNTHYVYPLSTLRMNG